MKTSCACQFFAVAAVLLVTGCVHPQGRFRPPDPIGYAIFEFFDREPTRKQHRQDAEYLSDDTLSARGHPPSADSIWVDGTWGTANGKRVWIPAHWQ